MSRQITTTVFQYDELSDTAKECARSWMRRCLDEDWSSRAEDLYPDMAMCMSHLGIEVQQRTERWRTRKGTERSRTVLDFEWSGFCSQGDGLVLRGSWAAERVDLAKLQEYAPQDKALHQLGIEFTAFKLRWPQAVANICTSSNGPGLPGIVLDEACVEYTGMNDDPELPPDDFKALKRMVERACSWAYRQLEANYDSDMEDESLVEAIEANEYEFTEDGERA